MRRPWKIPACCQASDSVDEGNEEQAHHAHGGGSGGRIKKQGDGTLDKSGEEEGTSDSLVWWPEANGIQARRPRQRKAIETVITLGTRMPEI